MEHPYSDHARSTAIHTVRRNYHTPVRPPQAIAAPCTASIETDTALLMDLLMYGIAAALIALGLTGSVVPLLPGIPSLAASGSSPAPIIDRRRNVCSFVTRKPPHGTDGKGSTRDGWRSPNRHPSQNGHVRSLKTLEYPRYRTFLALG
jgi:hypothetical protein